MISIKFENNSKIVLKEKKKFKQKHILLIVDNCDNGDTDDYDVEALLTLEESMELIKKLQMMVDTVFNSDSNQTN